MPKRGLKSAQLKVLSFDSYEAISQEYLGGLAEAYQTVFGEDVTGDGSVWSEGAYCDKEGRSKKISIDEYHKRLKNDNLRCPCGGKFTPYHSSSNINVNLVDAMSGRGVIKGRLCLLITKKNSICGFSWGSIRTTQSTIKKLARGYVKSLTNEETAILREKIKADEVLFFEEIGILRGYRGSSENLLALTAPILALTVERRTKPLVFRTLENSKVATFAKKIGFKILLDKERKPIIYCSNIFRIFLWLQVLGPKIMKVALRAANPVQ